MKVILFQSRFARMVESGQKKQTIRPVRKVPIKPGDMLSLREWTGLPYRSKQRELFGMMGEVPCVGVCEVRVEDDHVFVNHGGYLGKLLCDAAERTVPFVMNGAMLNDLVAKADGFKEWSEMRDWFAKTHGLPFTGILIRW